MSGYQSGNNVVPMFKSEAEIRAELAKDFTDHQKKIGELRGEIAAAEETLAKIRAEISDKSSMLNRRWDEIATARRDLAQERESFLLTQTELEKDLDKSKSEFEIYKRQKEEDFSAAFDEITAQKQTALLLKQELTDEQKKFSEYQTLREGQLAARERELKLVEEDVARKLTQMEAQEVGLTARNAATEEVERNLANCEFVLGQRQAGFDAQSAALMRREENVTRIHIEAQDMYAEAEEKLVAAKSLSEALSRDREALDIYKTELTNFEQVLKRREATIKDRETLFNQAVKGVSK